MDLRRDLEVRRIMKKIISTLIICTLLLTGCGGNVLNHRNEEREKQSKIELYSVQDDKLLKTIDNQDAFKQLLDTSNWEEIERLSSDLIPEYKMLVYQEKTLLYGQDPNEERDYELIETVITFQNSKYVQEIISSNVIKNMAIPEDAMTFYYKIPDDLQKELDEIIND